MLEIESSAPSTKPMRESLLSAIYESRTFRKSPVRWLAFYGTTLATILMFVILCALSAWSISIGHRLSDVLDQSSEILSDVDVIMPEVKNSLRIIKQMCLHENFTKRWGDICI